MIEREAEIRQAWALVRERALADFRAGKMLGQAAAPLPMGIPSTAEAAEIEVETFTFVRRDEPNGGFTVTCNGMELERVARARVETWGGGGLDDLCRRLNRLGVGDRVWVPVDALSRMSFNWMLYGDLWHAMRGQLIGSSYGTFERETRSDGWMITRREEGERIYDRDGYPVRHPETTQERGKPA